MEERSLMPSLRAVASPAAGRRQHGAKPAPKSVPARSWLTGRGMRRPRQLTSAARHPLRLRTNANPAAAGPHRALPLRPEPRRCWAPQTRRGQARARSCRRWSHQAKHSAAPGPSIWTGTRSGWKGPIVRWAFQSSRSDTSKSKYYGCRLVGEMLRWGEKVGERGKRETSETPAPSGRIHCFALFLLSWLVAYAAMI
jgi:hypothetical protein